MVKTVARIFFVLVVLDVLCMAGLILFVMTDDKPPAAARGFAWTLQNVLGFPSSLVNPDFPFFLNNGSRPAMATVCAGTLNNIVPAVLIAYCIKGIRVAVRGKT